MTHIWNMLNIESQIAVISIVCSCGTSILIQIINSIIEHYKDKSRSRNNVALARIYRKLNHLNADNSFNETYKKRKFVATFAGGQHTKYDTTSKEELQDILDICIDENDIGEKHIYRLGKLWNMSMEK